MKLRIHNTYEDRIEFYVDDEHIGSVDHDGVGWAGMEAAEQLLTAIAKAAGIEVVKTEGGSDDN